MRNIFNLGKALVLFIILFLATACGAGRDQYIFDRVVQIKSATGSCSGEQVQAPSGKNYILTAGHCRELFKNGAEIITENGKKYPAKLIAEDPRSDLLIARGIPGLKGLRIGKKGNARLEISTYTAGKGFKPYKTSGVLIQDIRTLVAEYPILSQEAYDKCTSSPKHKLAMSLFFPVCVIDTTLMASTAFTMPGSSGGAVIDSTGALVGIVSAGGDGYSYFVRLKDIQRFLKRF